MEKIKKEIITKEKFIELGRQIHNNKFDYSDMIYINTKTKVKLTCNRGHKIEVSYQDHINKKSDCIYCVREDMSIKVRKEAKENFYKRANEIHGNKYNYEKANYIDSHTKIIIICDKGHEFEQQPKSHLAGQGCKYCNQIAIKEGKQITNLEVKRITNKWTTEKFIEQAKEVHGDKFDYSMVNLISYKKNVKIKCRQGHVFEQKVRSHLLGRDCKKCSALCLTNEQFVEKSKKIFNDTFDYSKCNYINTNIKVILICSKDKHEFEVEPRHHYNSLGCPLCYNTTEGKMEKELRKIYNKELKLQFLFKNINEIKTYPFDFLIKNNKVIIELDGRQHFETVQYFQQPVEERQRIDFIKMYWAFKEGYSIIRIYQPDVYLDNFNWIEQLQENIKNYEEPKFICLAKNIKVYDEYCDNYKKFLENI